MIQVQERIAVLMVIEIVITSLHPRNKTGGVSGLF
jgi:hypothetical protein